MQYHNINLSITLIPAIVDACDGQIPAELTPAFNCKQYSRNNCVGARTPCYPREFSCSDGSCVPRDWLCDGTRDCPAGEDETEKCIKCDDTEYRYFFFTPIIILPGSYLITISSFLY